MHTYIHTYIHKYIYIYIYIYVCIYIHMIYISLNLKSIFKVPHMARGGSRAGLKERGLYCLSHVRNVLGKIVLWESHDPLTRLDPPLHMAHKMRFDHP